MRSEWELYAEGVAAADAILKATFGVDVRKALNPLNLHDFQKIVRSLSASLQGQVVPVEDAALKQALGKLDAKWTDMDAPARAKVIGEAAHYIGPPVVAKVLPKIDQTLAFAQKDIVPATKKNAVLTYDFKISPDLSATDERIANYVRVSQGHFITNKYGERQAQFADQARGIVAAGLEKGWGSADIADKLYGELSTHTSRGLAYWNTIAMVYANRARTMTQLASFHEARIESYVWESVLDEATSVQCRFLHGKEFPVAHAMQRFQQVEDADSPEAIKTLQPFVGRARGEGREDALVCGSGDDRQVVAHVDEDASGKEDETGSFTNAMDSGALQAAGVTTPPIHGNCRSTIIPKFGGSSGGGGKPIPPPPLPTPEKLTSGERKAQAIEHLDALPTATDGHADTSSLFTFHAAPPFLEHPMFAGDAGGELGAQWDLNATTKRPKLDELIATTPTVDRGVVAKLIQKPKALGDAPVPKVVQYEGKFYVVDGHEQLVAQRLLGQKTANCDFVNLDKRLKIPSLVHPIVPGPTPLPPTLVKPVVHPPPPPKKVVEVVPPPPMPRLWTKKLPAPAPDLVALRARVDVAAKKDAAILAGLSGEADRDRLEIAARAKLTKVKRSKTDVVVSFPTTVEGVEPHDVKYKLGLDNRAAMSQAVPERVLLEDYVAANNRCYGSTVEQHIRDLIAHNGTFLPSDDSNYNRDGPPVLLRIGDKLYPAKGGTCDPQMMAAKALGLKTLEVRVLDANSALAEYVAKQNAAIFPKQAERDRAYAAEVARLGRLADQRAERETRGSPEVVAVRAKHQPANYATKVAETYYEAAPSLGWGHAMQERGLDFPAAHLQQLASQFANVKDHPLADVGAFLRTELKGKTARQYIAEIEAKPPATDSYQMRLRAFEADDVRAVKSATAILAHVDGIQGHAGFTISSHAKAIGSAERTATQFNWLARLTDQSVVPADSYELVRAWDDRASCHTAPITSWKTRACKIELKKDEATKTVFHEIGHSLEAADRSRGLRASAFLDARTAGDKLESLRDLFPTHKYGAEEKARPDKFSRPYVGKDYGREGLNHSEWSDVYYGGKTGQKGVATTDQVHVATEVTSMAIEKIASGWRKAMTDDPEHFLFGLGQLGGY